MNVEQNIKYFEIELLHSTGLNCLQISEISFAFFGSLVTSEDELPEKRNFFVLLFDESHDLLKRSIIAAINRSN